MRYESILSTLQMNPSAHAHHYIWIQLTGKVKIKFDKRNKLKERKFEENLSIINIVFKQFVIDLWNVKGGTGLAIFVSPSGRK